MSYTKGRLIRDADSHIMELPDFLIAHGDGNESLPRIQVNAPRLQQGLETASVRRAHPPDHVAECLYMFSSDYPHVEGGRNPLGRFAASLADADEATSELFYQRNFARLFGLT